MNSTIAMAPPPVPGRSAAGILRRMALSPRDTLLSVVVCVLLGYILFRFLNWAVLQSVWNADSAQGCSGAEGACWAVLRNRWRTIFFGIYPYAEQWRALIVIGIFVAATAVTFVVGLRRARIVVPLWLVTLIAAVVLLGGGVWGLKPVSSDQWSGLPLTIFVFLCSVALGFPLAILLAVGRTGTLMSARILTTGLIELLRPLPLITVLFCADLVLPMMLPTELVPGKAMRIIISMAIFYACYQAEVLRAGFAAVPSGNIEAARALGLRRWQIMYLVILPQAFQVTVPATVNLMVVALKDTALIVTVGLIDFLGSANSAITANEWDPYFDEVYIVIAAVYLAMTLALARLGRQYER